MKRLWLTLIWIVAALFRLPVAIAAETVVVYTSAEPNLIPLYTRAFRAAQPDIFLKWVRFSGGALNERLLAEKNAPQADAVFGHSVTALLELKRQGALEPYSPKGSENIPRTMRDRSENPSWSGINVWAGAVIMNRNLLASHHLPRPATWRDLADPAYRGHLVMPDPGSSGTGLLLVNGWLAAMGPEQGWAFMEDLHQNIRQYTLSGADPGKMAVAGEAAVGLSSEALLGYIMKQRPPVEVVLPEGPLPWDMEGVALVKNGPNPDGAKKLLDFSTSPAVAQIAADNLYLPARADIQLSPEAAQARARLADIDFEANAAGREAVISEWRRRFAEER